MESKPKIIVAENARAAATAAAVEFVNAVRSAQNRNEYATVALSGGSTPRQMHRLLTRSPYKTAIDWNRVHLFWADDRLVPYYDNASNFGTACDDLIDPLQLDQEQVHPMPVTGNPTALADDYEGVLRAYFSRAGSQPPVFDLVCLGLGADGHTASLFPANPALKEKRRWVVAVEGGIPHVSRLTLTLPVINNAGGIMILATGESKAEIVRLAVKQPGARLPVQNIRPTDGSMVWILDASAAQLLYGNAR